jgi:small-conductance mechanosensitive channel
MLFFEKIPLGLSRLLIVALSLGFSYGLSYFLSFVLQRYLTAKGWINKTFRAEKHFGFSIFFLISAISLRTVWPLMHFSPAFNSRVDAIFGTLMIVFSAWVMTRTLKLIKIVLYTRINMHSSDNLRQRKIQTQVQFIEKIILIFVYVIAAALILMSFEAVRKLGASIIASAGLLGIIVGFAAQKSLGNLLAGFQIAFTQPIRLDDVVIVQNEWGKIEEINLTYVVVRLWDKRALIVPINYFIENTFQNWTRSSADLIGVVTFRLDFGFPLAQLRTEFEAFLKKSPLWDGQVSAVQVTEFYEQSMEVRLLMGAHNAGDAFDLRCLVREHLIQFLLKTDPNCLPRQRVLREDRNLAAAPKAPRASSDWV